MHEIVVTLASGALFGLGAGILLIINGRRPGISGITAGAINPKRGDFAWRVLFLLGLLAGGAVALRLTPEAFALTPIRGLPWIAVAGLCIGFGSRLANGCTSGHGICGIGRLSPRSIVATATFTLAGALTRVVWLAFGGAL